MAFNSEESMEEKYQMGSREGNWMKLIEGDNKIRFVSDDIDFGNHYDTQIKRSFTCIGKEECKYCLKGERPRVQYYAWVIDREDGEIKLMQFGHTIHKAMEAFAKGEDYAFESIPPYDVTVNRKGKGLDTEYTVLPARKDTPLTKEEKALVDEKCTLLEDIVEKMKEKARGNTQPDAPESTSTKAPKESTKEINAKEVVK